MGIMDFNDVESRLQCSFCGLDKRGNNFLDALFRQRFRGGI